MAFFCAILNKMANLRPKHTLGLFAPKKLGIS